MTQIVEMTALALAAAIRARSVSCVDVATAFLDQIDRYNGTINAIVSRRSRAEVLAEAADKDAMVARGQIMGPLHGLPQAIKDLDNVAGMITSKGSPL